MGRIRSFQELREGWRVALPKEVLMAFRPTLLSRQIIISLDYLNPYFSCTVHIGVI